MVCLLCFCFCLPFDGAAESPAKTKDPDFGAKALAELPANKMKSKIRFLARKAIAELPAKFKRRAKLPAKFLRPTTDDNHDDDGRPPAATVHLSGTTDNPPHLARP